MKIIQLQTLHIASSGMFLQVALTESGDIYQRGTTVNPEEPETDDSWTSWYLQGIPGAEIEDDS